MAERVELRALWVVAAIASVVASTLPASAAQPSQPTARALYPVALAAARAADPSVKLVGTTGVETTRPREFLRVYGTVDSPETAGVPPNAVSTPAELFHAALKFAVRTADARPGDGRAPAWAFHFAGTGGERAVVVDARRAVKYHRAVPSAAPLPSGRADAWRVDSSTMTDAAAAASSIFAKLRHRATALVHVLSTKSDRPTWSTGLLVGGISPRVCEFANVLVDATSGRVLARGVLYVAARGKHPGGTAAMCLP
jgi:hypothetical protein